MKRLYDWCVPDRALRLDPGAFVLAMQFEFDRAREELAQRYREWSDRYIWGTHLPKKEITGLAGFMGKDGTDWKAQWT